MLITSMMYEPATDASSTYGPETELRWPYGCRQGRFPWQRPITARRSWSKLRPLARRRPPPPVAARAA